MKRLSFPSSILAVLLLVVLAACSAPAATLTPTSSGTETLPLPAASATAQPVESSPVMVVGVAGERTIGDPYTPELGNSGYDVQRYTLRLALDPANPQVNGYAAIQALSSLDNLAQVSLDFVGFKVQDVRLDGAEVSFSREADKLLVDFPAPLALGAPFTLEVRYQGAPTAEPSRYAPFLAALGLQFPPAGQPEGSLFVVAEPDGARYWFPCNDHPRDKASYRFELIVPEGLTAAANGELVETRMRVADVFADGRAGDVYVWEHDFPMAAYLATVAVGAYERLEATSPAGVPLRSYVFHDQKEAFAARQPLIGAALDWMAERFGPYPFEAFGYAQVAELGASLETQTLVILAAQAGEGTMVHEMAHTWFGDWVSLDSWSDVWRNEGFATYISWLWTERNNPAGLAERIASVEQSYQAEPGAYPLDDPPPGAMFGRDSYYKGALLAHALHQEMGDEAFFRGLRGYFERYGGGTATHQQFQEALEEAAGRPLDAVFNKWLR